MALSDHPGFNKVIAQVNKLLSPVNKFIELYEENYFYYVMQYDFDWFINVKETVDAHIEVLDEYITAQQNRFYLLLNALRTAHALDGFKEPFDSTDYEVDFADLQRPIYYRLQELKEIKEFVDKVVT